MAFAGIIIVMCGLTVLSTIIAQLHKVVGWMERKKEAEQGTHPSDTQRALAMPDHLPEDPEKVAGIYKALTSSLDDTFELSALYAISVENDLPHPHISLRQLREAGILVCVGDGCFTWKS
jgi:hypothetical protein